MRALEGSNHTHPIGGCVGKWPSSLVDISTNAEWPIAPTPATTFTVLIYSVVKIRTLVNQLDIDNIAFIR